MFTAVPVVARVPPNCYFLEVRFLRQDSKIHFRYDSCALVIEIHNCSCVLNFYVLRFFYGITKIFKKTKVGNFGADRTAEARASI